MSEHHTVSNERNLQAEPCVETNKMLLNSGAQLCQIMLLSQTVFCLGYIRIPNFDQIRGTSCSEISPRPEFLSCLASQHQLFRPLVEGPGWLLCSLVQPHSSLEGPPVQGAHCQKGQSLTAGKYVLLLSIYKTSE